MKIILSCVLVGLLAFSTAHAHDDEDVNNPPEGAPVIRGIAEPGQVLSADITSIKDADGLGEFAYRWYRNGRSIKGKSKKNIYKLKSSDINYRISVRVRYVDGGGTKETLYSVETSPVVTQPVTHQPTGPQPVDNQPVDVHPVASHANSSPLGVPTIHGLARQGSQLRVDTSGISDADGLGVFRYQWLRDGHIINGASNSSYIPVQADVGLSLSIRVRYIDGGDTTETLTSEATSTIANINDEPVGLPTISGSPIQGAVLTAVTSGISDADGLGEFSYQWRRSGNNIAGATIRTYPLKQADVDKTMSVFVSYTDSGLTEESLLSKGSDVVRNVNDTGSVVIAGQATEGSELSLDRLEDGDGISTKNVKYQWLRGSPDSTGLCINVNEGAGIAGAITDKYLISEKDLRKCITLKVSYTDDFDVDEIIISNTKGPIFPDVPKVIPPATIEAVNATGWFTRVDLNPDGATASDALDGSLTPVSDASGYFRPGRNIVTWSATDPAGNVGLAEQVVNVIPMAQVSKMQVSAEGSRANFKIYLNGDALRYPVTVSYIVSNDDISTGAADSSDSDLVSAKAIITEPAPGKLPEVSIPFNIFDDGSGEGVETITVTLSGSPDDAVLGPGIKHTIQIVEGNVAPIVSLETSQMQFASDDAPVTVLAIATDANDGDSLTYDWSETDNALGSVITGDAFSFVSSGLTPGFYTLHVTVEDEVESVKSSILLSVLSELPVLSRDTDTDADGVTDAIEGYSDSDADGIADYQDAIQSDNVIQILPGISDKFILQTEPGLKLSLGELAFKAGHGGSLVAQEDVSKFSIGGNSPQDTIGNVGGYFDFTISGLSVSGEVVQVVIPQIATMPRQPIYRKLISSGSSQWQDFVIDANNSIASAVGAEGYCPPPGHQDYTPGLSQGHWCLQLTIEDGGPNDSDGVANHRITDPGGIGQLLSDVNVSSSSGGAWNPLTSILSIFTILLLRNKKFVEKKAA